MNAMTPGLSRSTDIPRDLERVDPFDAEAQVRAAMGLFGSKLTLSSSFGGAGGMVLLDMAVKIDPSIDVFVLDTDFLFPETYASVQAVEAHYGIRVRRARAALTATEQAALYGDRLWERDPDACCRMRKVDTMRHAVSGFDAYMTAIRRDQSGTRASTATVTWDAKFGLWKLAPLANWDEARVLSYVFNHDVPINPLLELGYTSIGCTHCTRKPEAAGGRTGRWAGLGKVECGLHSLDSLEGADATRIPTKVTALTVHGEDPII